MEKIIHQIWVGKYKMPKREKSFVELMKQKNSTWEHMLWTDLEVLQLNMPPNIKNAYNYFLKDDDYVAQADILRLFLVYEFGGIYLDVDFETRKGFDELNLLSYDGFICYHDTDIRVDTIPNGIFGSKKGNKLFEFLNKNISSNYHTPYVVGKFIKQYYNLNLEKTEHLGENGLLNYFKRDNIFYMPFNDFHNNYYFHHALYSHSPEMKRKFKEGKIE